MKASVADTKDNNATDVKILNLLVIGLVAVTGPLLLLASLAIKTSMQLAAIDKSLVDISESLGNGFSFISRPENPGKFGFEPEVLSINGRDVESLGTFSSQEQLKKTTKRPNCEFGRNVGVLVPLYYKDKKRGSK